MDKLWSPWRMEYIKKAGETGCIFCSKPRERRDRSNLILARSRYCFMMLNLYPYNSGHLMVAPYRHVGGLERMGDQEALDMFRLARAAVEALSRSYAPSGYNLGINIGRSSGAGIPGHIHLHIVPRWVGDTNFMPVLADTKVLPESLESCYEKIYAALPERLKISVINEG